MSSMLTKLQGAVLTDERRAFIAELAQQGVSDALKKIESDRCPGQMLVPNAPYNGALWCATGVWAILGIRSANVGMKLELAMIWRAQNGSWDSINPLGEDKEGVPSGFSPAHHVPHCLDVELTTSLYDERDGWSSCFESDVEQGYYEQLLREELVKTEYFKEGNRLNR